MSRGRVTATHLQEQHLALALGGCRRGLAGRQSQGLEAGGALGQLLAGCKEGDGAAAARGPNGRQAPPCRGLVARLLVPLRLEEPPWRAVGEGAASGLGVLELHPPRGGEGGGGDVGQSAVVQRGRRRGGLRAVGRAGAKTIMGQCGACGWWGHRAEVGGRCGKQPPYGGADVAGTPYVACTSHPPDAACPQTGARTP